MQSNFMKCFCDKFPDVGDGDISRRWDADNVPGTGPGVGGVRHLDRSGEESVGTTHTSSTSWQEALGGLKERNLLQEPHTLDQGPALSRHAVPGNGRLILSSGGALV